MGAVDANKIFFFMIIREKKLLLFGIGVFQHTHTHTHRVVYKAENL